MSNILEVIQGYNVEVEAALERFLNDKEMYLKYVTEFPEEPTMDRLNKAVAAEDYDEAEKAVHALKGILNNLGFITVADEAVDMLEELRDGEIETALEAYEGLTKEYDKITAVIKENR